MVSACGSCGAHICIVPRRHLGTAQDASAPRHRRVAGSLLSRLSPINEPGSSLLILDYILNLWSNSCALYMAQRGRTQDNDQSNCDLDCSPDARTAYDLVAMAGLPRLDGSPGILHAPPGTPLRPRQRSSEHAPHRILRSRWYWSRRTERPALTRCAAWDFRRRTRLHHQLWLGCVYGQWTSRRGRYGQSTIG